MIHGNEREWNSFLNTSINNVCDFVCCIIQISFCQIYRRCFQIRRLCNVLYRKFNFTRYPGHVRKLRTYAFKPIIIHVSFVCVSAEMPLALSVHSSTILYSMLIAVLIFKVQVWCLLLPNGYS